APSAGRRGGASGVRPARRAVRRLGPGGRLGPPTVGRGCRWTDRASVLGRFGSGHRTERHRQWDVLAVECVFMVGEYVPRAVAGRVLEALSDTPVVVVNGPRQSGKTTLVRFLPYAGRAEVVSLDDVATRQAAGYDPRAFLDRSVDTLVIDEA